MRSLIIFLLVAVCLGLSACPKGHKSFGGSSGDGASSGSTRGSGLFGGGVPSSAGAYLDIGNGWESAEPYRTDHPVAFMVAGMRKMWYMDESEFSSEGGVTLPSGKIRFAIRAMEGGQLSEMDIGANLYPLSLEDGALYIDDDNQARSALHEKLSDRQSLYTVDASLPGSGYYSFAVAYYTVHIRY